MKYILINQVVEKMYSEIILHDFLTKNGFIKVHCNTNWADVVKSKYKNLLKDETKTVVDMRCPMAVEEIKKSGNTEGLIFHDIEPILIHCAREISQREDLMDREKVIVTPCKSLAEYGNLLKLKDTKFYSWLDFLKELNQDLSCKPLKMTPIPLGFFEDLNVKQVSLSSSKEINEFFKFNSFEDIKLIEILYCDEGCHNGDGVVKDEED